MDRRLLTSALIAVLSAGGLASCAISSAARASAAQVSDAAELRELLSFLRSRNSTGFVVVRDGEVIIDETWAAPDDDRMFANFVYGRAGGGALLEDVASQQKSFIAILVAIAIDRGLIDVEQPVSTYLGTGWSRASAEQEAQISVLDVLTMSSGLNEQFGYEHPAGTTFFYNTPVYAATKRILVAASGQSLETITRDWLTGPVGMVDTEWRRRPAALASVGNDTGLVTTPHDVARFGQMVLDGGVNAAGERVVSQAQLEALFTRSETNPAYGRLWWLNGGEWSSRAQGGRRDGPLIAAAPADTVAALGAFDRRLYVVPSLRLVVVRTGAATNDTAFDQEFWTRLNAVLD